MESTKVNSYLIMRDNLIRLCSKIFSRMPIQEKLEVEKCLFEALDIVFTNITPAKCGEINLKPRQQPNK